MANIVLARPNPFLLAGGFCWRNQLTEPVELRPSVYDRSMAFLADALKIVDTATIYNNSFEHPLLIADKTRDGQLVIYPQEPPSIWNVEHIRKLVGLATKSPSASS